MKNIEERSERLKNLVRDRFAAWSQDREMFAKLYPGVTLTLPAGRCSPAAELRAVAETVMQGTGFDWKVVDTVNGEGAFFIGTYEGDE